MNYYKEMTVEGAGTSFRAAGGPSTSYIQCPAIQVEMHGVFEDNFMKSGSELWREKDLFFSFRISP